MQQIVYQKSLSDFINSCLVTKTISEEVKNGMYLAGYSYCSPNRITSWENSLPEIAKALQGGKIDDDVDVAVEYRLKHSLERLDFLIYGLDKNNNKNIVIVELKQWSQVGTTGSLNKVYAQVSKGVFKDTFHPSYQAYSYANQLKAFNEYVQNEKVDVESCSYCHYMDNGYETIMDDISLYPFVKDSPAFLEDDGQKLRNFVEKYVSKRCHEILYEINKSRTVPSDNFAKLIDEALKGSQMYTLDMTQAHALTTIVDAVRTANYYNQKKTIIIKGGAGTGKSIIAMNALGLLNSPKKKDDRIATFFVTVNSAPKKTMYRGLIKNREFTSRVLSELFKYPTSFANRPFNDVPCLLIDEAHRIFKMKGGIGLKKGTNILKEIINAAKISVFFIDDNQAICKDDYATVDKIKELAKDCHSDVIMGNDLELMGQYRVQGGAEYISFIKSLLNIVPEENTFNLNNTYDFRVFDDPNEMFEKIKELDTRSREEQAVKEGKLPFDIDKYNGHARLVAGYCYDWASDPEKRDGKNDVIISKYNFAKKRNLRKGNGISAYSWVDDPESINEIGCVHTVQGIDLDYCGVIIGKDLTYRDGKLVFHKEEHPASDKSGIRTANEIDAETWIRNSYYVLLTRGIKGTFVFCEDEALRDFIKSRLVK